MTCERPPFVEHAYRDGDLQQEMYPSGAQIRYTCNDGYFADGEAHAMCSSDGRWVGLQLVCTRKYVHVQTFQNCKQSFQKIHTLTKRQRSTAFASTKGFHVNCSLLTMKTTNTDYENNK